MTLISKKDLGYLCRVAPKNEVAIMLGVGEGHISNLVSRYKLKNIIRRTVGRKPHYETPEQLQELLDKYTKDEVARMINVSNYYLDNLISRFKLKAKRRLNDTGKPRKPKIKEADDSK